MLSRLDFSRRKRKVLDPFLCFLSMMNQIEDGQELPSLVSDLSYLALTNDLICLFINQAVMLYRVMPGMISIGLLIKIKLLKKKIQKAGQSNLALVTRVEK
ncbi:hypothetical protein PGT21_033896 [Puccinia graminis f. sp. tritici]|uniref:Uncharacterized protein n=1 Tax=Puccinia graminis f. sp. tritici TaxID=56615 RepID=A0A5B0MGM6_PUCGR|nr:hypothetical protein PGTUg99_035385 [Puccinia graminis f. sp. tritici]KAA1091447.1 hypothetical protein PGT21_033896 [Puccinia graminis f. sp. tritici]